MKIKYLFLIVILIIGGALDFANRGLLWQFAWSVTGEEAPIAQIRGLIEWSVSQTRPQPKTDPLTPIDHVGVNPYGINTFWNLEVEPEKVEAQAQMIAEAGFAWIRQQIPWEDLEVDGRGQFTDSRNDLNGDGTPDTIDAWLKYDRIVEVAERYGLQIQARLDNPPSWTHADPAIGDTAPPDDLQDFINYAVAVAERYKGHIHYYQIWNEPNIYPEWGNQSVNPEAYTELLCRTYDALKAVDPDIVIISGALAPTVSLTGRDLNDFIFLQRMYQAGAAACFDILSIQGYGLNSGPTDRRMRPTNVNIARNLYIRDLMIANGDAHKPMWVSEAAWNSVPSEADYPEDISLRYAFGQVTQQQAADYMPQFYERAAEEWPWIGVVNYWFFTRQSDSERNQSFYYFRMVEPDYNPANTPPFTPLPVYTSMKDHIIHHQPTLYQGVHQVETHYAIQMTGEPMTLEDAEFGQAAAVTALTFTAEGTHVLFRWQGGTMTVQTDDDTSKTISATPGEWHTTTIYSSLLPEAHTLTVTATDTPIMVDSIMVVDRTYENLAPLVTIGVVVVVLLTSIGWSVLSPGRIR